MTELAQSPVSFIASVQRLPQKGMPVEIAASEKQRAALAEIHGLLSVESFRAELLVRKWKGDGVSVRGTVRATIEQACIVTLEPVPATIDENVDALFVPAGSKLARPNYTDSGELLLDAEGPDAPEIFEGDSIDVGALAEELFALGIDPYPRKSGVDVSGVVTGDDLREIGDSPFGKLLALKQKS